MRASLIRTGSVPVLNPVLPGSPRVSLTRQASFAGDRNHVQSPRLSMHFHSNHRKDTPPNGINRASTGGAMIRSASEDFGVRQNPNRSQSRSFPRIIPDEEEFLSDGEGRTALRKPLHVRVQPESRIPVEELGFGNGSSEGGDHGTATVTGGNGGERIKIGAYYAEMLKSNPTDSLLLRNYAKFLHEVEKDTAKAEEYYGRAILANPSDGELLSLYGKLIWETERDGKRAKSYFDQAIHVAPDDCTVLGSYAHFTWEAEEEEEEEEEEEADDGEMKMNTATGMIAAF
ncbi:uncharacterized protein LOC113869688 [Abrus precatorius]|uniref:Uncharacterized protein LOC113869688 n=1 Tax=Abrus precatorius TaxID=3816 RepID=A0A8B8M3Z3_ABRPR|nr:uncharacterized protein LOC113869688 [Abrus precatorius]